MAEGNGESGVLPSHRVVVELEESSIPEDPLQYLVFSAQFDEGLVKGEPARSRHEPEGRILPCRCGLFQLGSHLFGTESSHDRLIGCNPYLYCSGS